MPFDPLRRTALRVLVVEDHDDSRELVAEVIRETGEHEIALAKTAKQGLQYLCGAPYDLIVTDLGLPDVSGLEMLDEARSRGLLARDVSAVVCSAHHSLRARILERGATFIPKPVELGRIVEIVRGLPIVQKGLLVCDGCEHVLRNDGGRSEKPRRDSSPDDLVPHFGLREEISGVALKSGWTCIGHGEPAERWSCPECGPYGSLG